MKNRSSGSHDDRGFRQQPSCRSNIARHWLRLNVIAFPIFPKKEARHRGGRQASGSNRAARSQGVCRAVLQTCINLIGSDPFEGPFLLEAPMEAPLTGCEVR
jgi:hypothetical protein